jgi:hypothetical protein
MKKLYFLLFVLSVGLSACKKDTTASWLKIDEVTLTTNAVTEGENTHAITHLWVYMDSKSLGLFELPLNIPIQAEGEHDFMFFAGVKKDGFFDSAHPVYQYPFYNSINEKITLIKKETYSYTPNFTYKSGISFVGKEDFEDTGIILQNDPNEDTTQIHIISKTNQPNIVKYGNSCGHIKISSIDTIAQVFTDIGMTLPKGKTIMELDYMNSNTFAQGVITNVEILDPYLLISAQEESSMKWKKMYIDIGAQINYLTYSASALNYYFTVNVDDGVSTGDIYLDNIKILYFE